MIRTIQDWVLDVDIQATAEYAAKLHSDHCECGYCRNYYTTVRQTYPKLEAFLSDLAVDMEAPVDFLPVEPTLCIVSYAVCGKIIRQGSTEISLGDVTLLPESPEELDYTLSCPGSYFVLTTSAITLPWILDEDMDEVVSPANEPECLERMWKKLLNSADFSAYQS